jgi:hypothetical protein
VIAFPGTRTPDDLAFVIENIAPAWMREALFTIIPFYRIAREVFFGAYESDISESVALAIAGPNRLSVHYWFKGSWFMQAILELLQSQAWPLKWMELYTGSQKLEVRAVVGHGSYGLLAKGLAWQKNWPGLAFDSSQYFDSPVSIYESWATDRCEKCGWTTDFYSGLSAQVLPEVTTLVSTSHMMPSLGGYFDTSTTEETFCMTVAGCAVTSRYDLLCETLIGSHERYFEMFKAWNRTRVL